MDSDPSPEEDKIEYASIPDRYDSDHFNRASLDTEVQTQPARRAEMGRARCEVEQCKRPKLQVSKSDKKRFLEWRKDLKIRTRFGHARKVRQTPEYSLAAHLILEKTAAEKTAARRNRQ